MTHSRFQNIKNKIFSTTKTPRSPSKANQDFDLKTSQTSLSFVVLGALGALVVKYR